MALTIATGRLELVAGTAEMARAEIDDQPKVFRLLEAETPDDWPPPLNDAESMKYFVSRLERGPEYFGWMWWYIALGERRNERRVLVGNIGFKDLPDADGSVEIGYSILPGFQRQGYATEAVRGLVAWAFSHPEVRRVIAETFPDLTASIRVLERNGFSRIDEAASEPGAVRFERSR
jgi:ribosomal-protein-alanine N-acetyltransferase